MDRLGDVGVEHLREHPRALVDEVDLQPAVAEVAGHLDAERRGADTTTRFMSSSSLSNSIAARMSLT